MHRSLLALLLLATARPALADEALPGQSLPAEPTRPSLALSWDLSSTTDYRNRGITVTKGRPVVQQSLILTHESGFYGNLWASTIAAQGRSNSEFDLVAGFARETAFGTFDLSAVYYAFPGISHTNYYEVNGRVTRKLGGPELGLLVSYAPRQHSLADRDNLYLQASASLALPQTPLTVRATAGLENGAFGAWKRDWSAGIAVDVHGFALSATYVDTAHTGHDPLGKPGLVLGVGRGF